MFVYNLLMDTETSRSKVRKRKAALNVSFCVKKEKNTVYKKVSIILRKPLAERSNDEIELLDNSKDIVQEISNKQAQRQKIKDRSQEYEDPANVLTEKCKILADAVINSNHLVVYTGAGISTAACIPDYRGSNGIWTLLQQGKDIGLHDLSQAEPTLTHMALYSLYRRGILKHVVSQNCDGLHLRSGLPRKILSEVHGNMYLEVCSKCKPSNHYWRLFDVTEYTARYSHETLRLCYKCGNPLKDTIVHFGERGKLQWPLNWDTACKQADKADVILCLGSSLKVLKKYPWLWCMDKPAKKRPKLYIVNLQWTPKDDHSTLKINGKCDTVIEQMMAHLSLDVPNYDRSLDPIFHHATSLHECELHTTSRSPIEKNPKTVGCVTVQHSPDVKPKLEDGSSQSYVEEDGDTSMCSASQSISSVAVNANENEAKSHATDLISSNDLVLEDDVVIIKEENASNTYSDKENIDTDDDVKSRNSIVGSVKVELANEIDRDDGQSNLSVISDQSSDYIVPEISVKMEDCEDESMSMNTHVAEKCDDEAKPETLSAAAEGFSYFSENTSIVVPFPTWTADMAILQNNALQWYFGRNPWSDLSLFDIFTQKPIFFAQPMLGFGSNLVSYPNASVSPLFGSFFNYASIWPSTSSPSSVSITEEAPAEVLPDCDAEAASSSIPEGPAVVPETVAEEPRCAFCFEHYKSKSCLFYTEHSSNDPLDASSVCLCCDGDEDDDQADGEEPPAEESADKTAGRVNNVNPGWFGKGYRKKIKKRKG